MLLRRILLVVLTLALMTSSAQAQKKLRWKWNKGDVLHQKMTMDMKTEVPGVPGGEAEVKQTTELNWTVEDVDSEQVASITQKISRVQMSMVGAGQKFDYDSDSDKEIKGGIAAVLKPTLEALTKASFKSKINSMGKVVDIKIPDDVAKSLRGGPASGMSADSLTQMIKQGAMALPADGVKKGTTWETKMVNKLPNLGNMTLTSKMTYDGEEKSGDKVLDRIKIDMTMSFDKKNANPLAGNVTIKDQKNSGVLYFDNKLGRMVKTELKQGYTLLISVGGREIEQKIKQDVKVEITKK